MSRRILIVEDHPTMREAMRLVLEREGFEIDEASDGDQALAAVRDDPPDLVLLDMSIPGTAGPDVLAAIKSDPSTSPVRVIVVTATGEEGRSAAMAVGRASVMPTSSGGAFSPRPSGARSGSATVRRPGR